MMLTESKDPRHAGDPLRICILANQYFGWGKIGGFGSMARRLAEGLAAAGHGASAIVPRRQGQPSRADADGVSVHAFSPRSPREAARMMREVDAEVFHSQELTVLTALAQWVRPEAVHVVTCRDPRDAMDWLTELRDATWGRRLRIPLNYALEGSFLVRRAVRRADGVYAPARFLQGKAKDTYRLRQPVGLLPNLIHVPVQEPVKSDSPTLAFVGRLERRKRPEVFLDLARRFPGCRFAVVGRAESETRDRALREQYAGLPNVEWHGYIDRFKEPERMHTVLEQAWVLVNTSSREGLPMTFLEAAAFGCAVISALDPDGFTMRFGIQARDDDFAGAVQALLGDPAAALAAGLRARAYVREVYEWDKALAAHVAAYREHLDAARRTAR